MRTAEFYRVLRRGCCAALCVISTPDRAPMWGVVADVLSRFVPEQRDLLYLSFALADANRLEHMFSNAGFRDVRVERVQRGDTISNFDDIGIQLKPEWGLWRRFMSLSLRPIAAQRERR